MGDKRFLQSWCALCSSPPQDREVCAHVHTCVCLGMVNGFLLILRIQIYRETLHVPCGETDMCTCGLENTEAEAGAVYQATK